RGLFGLEPDILHGRMTIEHRFPGSWKKASIAQPTVSYEYEELAGSIRIKASTPRPLAKTFRIPVRRGVVGVTVGGKAAEFKMEAGVNQAHVIVESSIGSDATAIVTLQGAPLQASYQCAQILGTRFTVSVQAADNVELVDP